MALPKDEFELFKAFLREKTKGKPFRCPVCDSPNWSVDGPVVLLQYDTEMKTAVVGGGGIPLITMVCQNCYFSRHFAWNPIVEGKVHFSLPSEDSDV